MKQFPFFAWLSLVGLGCGVTQDLGNNSTVAGGSGGATTSTGMVAGSSSTGQQAASTSATATNGSTGSGGAGTSTGGSTGSGGAGTGTSTGVASNAATSSTVAATGSGGATGSTSNASAASSAQATGSGGGNACSGYIDVSACGIPCNAQPIVQHFAEACPGRFGASATSTAIGYRVQGGSIAIAILHLDGCATYTSGSASLDFSLNGASTTGAPALGTYMSGTAAYTDASGAQWTSVPGTINVVITKFDNTGGAIEGTFSVTVSNTANVMLSLTGAFHVCDVGLEAVP